VHRILLRTVIFDYPGDVHDAGRDFWRIALNAGLRRGVKNPSTTRSKHPAALGSILVQNLNDGASRIHLDIEADDTDAEVDRLVAAGAVEVEADRRLDRARDPGGLLFCVVPAELDEGFAQFAHTVGS